MPTDADLEAQAEALRSRSRGSSLQRLMSAIAEKVELTISETGRAYASLDPGSRYKVCALDSSEFKGFITAMACENKITPSPNIFSSVMSLLEHQAAKGEKTHIYNRYGHHNGNVYIDRGTDDEPIVKISPTGVELINTAPLLFARTAGMLELPKPDLDGSLNDIDALVRHLDPQPLKLLKGAIIAAAHPAGPYFIAQLIGPAGSGKTCIARMVRSLIDPNAAPLRSIPKKSDDLFAIASNEYMSALDNVSALGQGLTNEFCLLATGGAATNRKFFVNRGAVTQTFKGPVVMTAISLPSSQPDFLNRSIVIHVPMMPDRMRETEAALMRRFDDMYARLFGGLCKALLACLRNIDRVSVPGEIRMIDAAKWVAAAEQLLGWRTGEGGVAGVVGIRLA
jgi:putative DNA primase/helicase